MSVTVEAKGNAAAVGDVGNAFSFLVIKIVIGNKFDIDSGSAVGSSLYISCVDKGVVRGITLANFTITYNTKQVLADTTPWLAPPCPRCRSSISRWLRRWH